MQLPRDLGLGEGIPIAPTRSGDHDPGAWKRHALEVLRQLAARRGARTRGSCRPWQGQHRAGTDAVAQETTARHFLHLPLLLRSCADLSLDSIQRPAKERDGKVCFMLLHSNYTSWSSASWTPSWAIVLSVAGARQRAEPVGRSGRSSMGIRSRAATYGTRLP
jgi:hypothetical protein